MKSALRLLLPLAVVLLPIACIVRIGGPDAESVTHVGSELPAREKREIDAPLKLSKGEPLHLRASFGEIVVEVLTEGKPSIHAELAIRAETKEQARAALETYRIERRHEGGALVVRIVGEPILIEHDGVEIEQTPTVSLHAVVPPGTPLVLESSSGDIDVQGALGHVEARSSFGDITVEGVSAVDVSASSGDIEVTGLRGGACRVATSFGDVDLSGVLMSVDARASSGDVTVTAMTGTLVAGPWSISSSFGDVELTLPAGTAFRVEAKTSFGSIETEMPGHLTETTSGGQFAGTFGDGGGLVTLSTSSGDVTLETR